MCKNKYYISEMLKCTQIVPKLLALNNYPVILYNQIVV